MISSSPLEKALPGSENAKDWLTMKIVEYKALPMDDNTAKMLSIYNGAYNALCEWGEDQEEDISAATYDHQDTFTSDTAKAWMASLQNADGTNGPHWTLEQAKQIMAQRKLSLHPYEFWVALNIMFSDFSPVVKKHGLGGSLDFYVDMAKAFLDDKDAQPNKLIHYYENIVK